MSAQHLDAAALAAGLDHIRASPRDHGRVELVVRRPGLGQREILDRGELSPDEGLVGDTWAHRGSRRTPDGSAHPDMQLNVINARFSALIAGGDDGRRASAGDQLHVDLDLSSANAPPGTRLSIGAAVIEITDQPHTGCAKFTQRFGAAALRFANGPSGRQLNLRGVNARVLQPGAVRRGDPVVKLDPPPTV